MRDILMVLCDVDGREVMVFRASPDNVFKHSAHCL